MSSTLIFGGSEVMSADLRHALQSALKIAKAEQEKALVRYHTARSMQKAHRDLPFVERVKIYFAEKNWVLTRNDILLSHVNKAEWELTSINVDVKFLETFYEVLDFLSPDGFHLTVEEAKEITKWLSTPNE